MNRKEVVVTGYGIVSCLGSDPSVYFDKMLIGESGINYTSSFDRSNSMCSISGEVFVDYNIDEYISRKESRRLDPYIKYAVIAAMNAVKMSNIDFISKEIITERCGVSIGTCVGGMQTNCEASDTFFKKGSHFVSPFFIPYLLGSMASGIVSTKCGIRGPSSTIISACASSNSSIIHGMKQIRSGESDIMLVGGSESCITPQCVAGFTSLRLLSSSTSHPSKAMKPWDKHRNGFVLSEGAAVLILEEKEHAIKRGARIYSTVLGGYENSDAYHMTLPREDGSVLAKCIEQTLIDASLQPSDIDYINPHATSTLIGDVAEMKAIKTVFGNSSVSISSTKSYIGHALGASGALEAISCIESLRRNKIHGTMNTENISEDITMNIILDSKDIPLKYVLSNSFGFGGHNACIVLGKS